MALPHYVAGMAVLRVSPRGSLFRLATILRAIAITDLAIHGRRQTKETAPLRTADRNPAGQRNSGNVGNVPHRLVLKRSLSRVWLGRKRSRQRVRSARAYFRSIYSAALDSHGTQLPLPSGGRAGGLG